MVQMTAVGNKVRSFPVRFRYLFLLATVFGGCFFLLSISTRIEILFLNNEPLNAWNSHRYEIIDDKETFTIKTEGCTIPALRPFDVSVKKFIKRPDHIRPCRNVNSSLLDNNDTHIWIRFENVHHFDIPYEANMSCCYKSFYRPAKITDIFSSEVDNRAQYESCVEFTNYIEVTNEFVKVSCGHEFETIYEQFFLFAPIKPMYSSKEDSTELMQNQSSNAYNVIILGVDAISRLNFHRTMPKTLAYLKQKGAIELLGYNKVGDNTFPNLSPMLLGVDENELKMFCLPHERSNFDNCPFIWHWFKNAGYYTAFGEDSASLGTFNYGRNGFSGSPTDYYIHTFIHEAEVRVGNNADFNSNLCMGNKYFYKVLLDYIENLATTLKSSKLFGFFWEVTMSHDYLNYPMLMDEDYESFLRKLDTSNYLDNTVLILLSDHGIRWGGIRFTKQGRLEERLPLVQILLPSSFKKKYSMASRNLKLNSKRLTTPFDIHAMLNDLINLEKINDTNIELRSHKTYAHDRSISLFLPIPKNRTCKLASIADHWCTCHKSKKMPIRKGIDAANYLVNYMNILLREHVQCIPLTLAEVLEVREMFAGTPEENEEGWREFLVVIRTSPGDGVFEATLRRDMRQWSLTGTVSRLNLYGDQSRCVHHYHLKLYCFCR